VRGRCVYIAAGRVGLGAERLQLGGESELADARDRDRYFDRTHPRRGHRGGADASPEDRPIRAKRKRASCDQVLLARALDRNRFLPRRVTLVAGEAGQVIGKVGTLWRRDQLPERDGVFSINRADWRREPDTGGAETDVGYVNRRHTAKYGRRLSRLGAS